MIISGILIKNINGLDNRDNIILSKSLNIDKLNGRNIVKSFISIEAIDEFIKEKNYSELWVIGGAEIYELFLNNYKKLENSIFNINEIFTGELELIRRRSFTFRQDCRRLL